MKQFILLACEANLTLTECRVTAASSVISQNIVRHNIPAVSLYYSFFAI